ncbi:uncharacterized protein [Dermacentor albipictus]|uniref:uncharacterized protein n=1 Tax=Dermacentor albipictus TaxID=60249 RepID=UPI0038FC8A4C
MRKLFRLTTLGFAVCVVLIPFLLHRKLKTHRGTVLILRGGHHPYIRHNLHRLGTRRMNRSCPNKYDRQVTNALKLSDQFIREKLLTSAHYNRTITYEDDSTFPKSAVNDLFPYSAFLNTSNDVRQVDIISIAPTHKGEHNKIQQRTTCYIDFENSTISTPVVLSYVFEHMKSSYGTAFISCRYPPHIRSVPVRVALATTGSRSYLRWLNVHYSSRNHGSRHGDRKVLLTLCVGPLYEGYNQLSQIVEFFAYYSVMGIEHFHLYLTDVPREVAALLQLIKFSANVSISFHLWNVDLNAARVAFYGQMAAIQDCIYRSKTTSEYTVHVDFDEFLVPSDNKTLAQTVVELENTTEKKKLGSLVAPNWFFCYEYPPRRNALWERPLMLSRVLVVRERTPWEHNVRSKYIASTSATIVGGVHYVLEAVNGSEHVQVSTNTLVVNHYRRCCGLVNEKAKQALVPDEPDLPDVVNDYRIQAYGMQVLASPVIAVIQRLGELP